jgi:hypothetical protein
MVYFALILLDGGAKRGFIEEFLILIILVLKEGKARIRSISFE